MSFQLPESFSRSTRWATVEGGVEVGPYSAEEIVQLLLQRKLNPDSTVVELNSRRVSLIREVGPFAQSILAVVREERKRQSDAEFERTSDHVAGRGRGKRVLLAVAVLLLAGGALGALAWFNPFAPPPVAGPEVEERRGTATAQQEVAAKEEEPQEEFTILEVDPAEQEQRELERSGMLESLIEEHQIAPTADKLAAGEKLEGATVAKKSAKAAAKGTTKESGGGGEAGSHGGGTITTIDFTDEEEDEEEGGKGAAELATERLRETMKGCAEAVLDRFAGEDWVQVKAQAVVHPDGRLKELKVEITPNRFVGEVKMCASAELMRVRVAPFEGEPIPVKTQLVLDPPEALNP